MGLDDNDGDASWSSVFPFFPVRPRCTATIFWKKKKGIPEKRNGFYILLFVILNFMLRVNIVLDFFN